MTEVKKMNKNDSEQPVNNVYKRNKMARRGEINDQGSYEIRPTP